MNINFIWIGDVVPPSFIENYKKCAVLNPHHTINLFRDKDLENFAKQYGILEIYNQVNLVNRDRKSTRLNSSHVKRSRMPSSA